MASRPFVGISVFITAATAASFLGCRQEGAGTVQYYTLYQGPAAIGNVAVRSLGTRRDAEGPYSLTRYDVFFYRWFDGAGVRGVRCRAVAARRPGRPVFYVAGNDEGGSFLCRVNDRGYRLTVATADVVIRRRGPAPAFFYFRGAPLPLPGRAPAADAMSVDLATGEQITWKRKGNGLSWETQRPADTVRVSYDAGGVAAVFAAEGISIKPAAAPSYPNLFYYRRPAFVVTPYFFPHPGAEDVFEIPLYVRLTHPFSETDLAGPGQTFTGTVAGDVALGVFTISPSLQKPLAVGAGASATAKTWPLIEAGDAFFSGLSHLPRSPDVTYVAGVGIFAGNVIAPCAWVETPRGAFALPGQPLPTLRVSLKSSREPVGVERIVLTGPPRRNRRPLPSWGEGIPGLRSGAELEYMVYKKGAAAGTFHAAYEALPEEKPFFIVYGEVAGVTFEDAAAAAYADGGAVRNAETAAGFAELLAAGVVLRPTPPGGKPPLELTLPTAPPTLIRRTRWAGRARELVGDTVVEGFVFDVRPEGFACLYDERGVLIRARWADYEARLLNLPKTNAAAAALTADEPSALPPAPPPPGHPEP